VRDALYAAIHDRVTTHIEDKKQEIARGLIAQHDEEVDMDPEDDDNEPEDEDAVSESSPFDVLDKTKKYKSQIPVAPGKRAGFSHKRVSTGDIYSRDAKDEPATPSKKK
jgi:hypothetical protein